MKNEPERGVMDMLAMHFLSLTCHKSSLGAGADEIYLIINGHRVSAPGLPDVWSLDDGDSTSLNFFNSGLPPGVPETRFTITLMDEDTWDLESDLFHDDNLGTVSFTVNDFDWFDDFWGKIREFKFFGKGSNYSLFCQFMDIA
ncbi:hypothetical protein ABZ565_29330 [Streptomyces sp. NPDC016469]|uniref:hypothetical protein n=1 Tax=Streptomyces sp. NPDC016469 TaxID=3157191 RepID=UPI0033F9932C